MKNVAIWCVRSPAGNFFPATSRFTVGASRQALAEIYAPYATAPWKNLEAMGYTCVRVRIVPVK